LTNSSKCNSVFIVFVDISATAAAFIETTVHQVSLWWTVSNHRCVLEGPANFHTSMITYCSPQRHLVDSHFDEGSSSCQNVNKNNEMHRKN